ncbi:MAG: NAD(P)/FAD-dependent oxidoreductase [Nocardioidaceae bacterium]
MRYDVIVVGARVAGSATALLLARAGLKVLVLDRARFPSDTLSTHQLQTPGGARLAAWGLLDRLTAASTPATRRVRFEIAGVRVEGGFPATGGNDALHSPRRRVLDAMLVDAAREAGAEVREGVLVEDLVVEAGRVAGVRGRERRGADVRELAGLVVGADGKHSLVARRVGAQPVRSRPAATVAFYTYWDGVALDRGWVANGDRTAVGAWPTNDGLVITYLAWPADRFAAYRKDPEAAVRSTLARAGELGERVLAGRRAEPVRGTNDVPNEIRRSHGPGWALAGDAGLVMDPITGQGMGHALRDAELLSTAVVAGLGGATALPRALEGYVRERDRQTRGMFDFTVGLTALRTPVPAERDLFAAIAASPAEADRFLGVLSGAVPPPAYFSPRHLVGLVGVRGFSRLARTRPRPRRTARRRGNVLRSGGHDRQAV